MNKACMAIAGQVGARHRARARVTLQAYMIYACLMPMNHLCGCGVPQQGKQLAYIPTHPRREPLAARLFGRVLLLVAPVTAAAQTDSPLGTWLTEKKSGIVELYRCNNGDTLCGRLVWFKIKPDDPNPQGLDLNDPDPARRNQSLCGLKFMYGFKSTEPNSWEDGSVYDPDERQYLSARR